MAKPTDIRCTGASLYFLPVHTRMPLKFGTETVSYVTCARVRVKVVDAKGRTAEGWGETPLSVAWVWPSGLSWDERETRMCDFCVRLADEVATFGETAHPMELGHRFQEHRLETIRTELNRGHNVELPHL